MATPRACPSFSALRTLVGVEEVFDRDAVRLAVLDHGVELAVDRAAAVGERGVGAGDVMAPQRTRRWRRPSLSTQP